eukprot:TRINITY_DN15153_c0_g1_i1.p1 TRINITY_DN15153_c0_g1~~TRINITY_DN15153_c0_g1_i1.p1  ORF type:complete len:613 (-),score=70.77 TRINITY_DN15153_c0_g1_i1:70-1908(-)
MHIFWPKARISANQDANKCIGIAVGCQTNRRYVSVCDIVPVPKESDRISDFLAKIDSLCGKIVTEDVVSHFNAPLHVVGVVGTWTSISAASDAFKDLSPARKLSVTSSSSLTVEDGENESSSTTSKRRSRRRKSAVEGTPEKAVQPTQSSPKLRQLLVFRPSKDNQSAELLGKLDLHSENCSYGVQDAPQEGATSFVQFNRPRRNEFLSDLHECNPSLSSDKATSLEFVLRQLNMSRFIGAALKTALKNSNKDNRANEPQSVKKFARTYSQPLLYPFAFILVHLVMLLGFLFKPIQYILSLKLGSERFTVKSISLLAEQIDRRLTLLSNMVVLWKELHDDPARWQSTGQVARRWIKLYNFVLIVIADWALGLFVVWLWWNFLRGTMHQHLQVSNGDGETFPVPLWGYQKIRESLEWLRGGRPGGVKLNIPTSNALSSLFLFYSSQWAVLISHWSEYMPTFIYVFPICSLLGLSFLLSAVYDTIFFVNMHIYWMYTGMSRLYNVQLHILQSLWLLFRGKKRNVLKDRIDSCDYSVDQFLLGTVVFATLGFLLPTVIVYYLLFLVAISAVTVLRFAFKLLNLTMNQFPVYSIILHLFGFHLSDAVVLDVHAEVI